jgi:hypothetical protein
MTRFPTIRSRLRSAGAAAAMATCTMLMTALPATTVYAADAEQMFKAMTDYLGKQDALSFTYDSTIEVVTTDMQKVGLASSGTLSLKRPDKVRMTRTGIADVELVSDGKSATALGKNLNIFATLPVEGTIDDLIDVLRFDFGFEAPAADLLSPKAYEIMTSNVTESKDFGSGVIGGQVCDHLGFRTNDTDWEIWIADGDAPYPCRVTITSKMMALAPSYTIQISNWKAGAGVATDDFKLATGDAKEVKIEELGGLDDVAGMIKEGDAQ